MNSFNISIKALLFVLLLPLAIWTPSAIADDYEPVTVNEPTIPVDELTIMLKPLTKSDLEMEVSAWMALVKTKSIAVSTAEIAIKQKNTETKTAKVAVEALEEAQEALAGAGTDTGMQEEAAVALEVAQEAVQETVEASVRAEDTQVEGTKEGAADALAAVATAGDDTTKIAASAEIAAGVAAEAAEQKGHLLEDVNVLRDERTALIDRARTVLNELDLKGGDSAENRLYLVAVSGVKVDVSDWDAVKATATGWFSSEQGGVRWLLNFIKFATIIIGFWILSIIIGRIADRMMNTRHSRKMSVLMRNFLSKLARRLVLLVGFIAALAALEVNTGPIVAAIGAAGFVVAFALQDSLSNLASGIMILVYRPFDVGDVVETGGVSGKVTSLNLVSVGIKTFDNKLVLVPNNNVWNDVIVNATGVSERRVDMVFGIGYGDDMDAAQKVLERIVEEHPMTLSHPEPVIKVHELADSSVNYICRPWVKTDDYWDVYWDITRKVKEEFDREGISIPFPQQDVHMHQVNPEV